MSDKNKNENKNVIEKLLDSVITYSQSNRPFAVCGGWFGCGVMPVG